MSVQPLAGSLAGLVSPELLQYDPNGQVHIPALFEELIALFEKSVKHVATLCGTARLVFKVVCSDAPRLRNSTPVPYSAEMSCATWVLCVS